MLEIHLNGFLNVSGVYDQSFYAFFGFMHFLAFHSILDMVIQDDYC